MSEETINFLENPDLRQQLYLEKKRTGYEAPELLLTVDESLIPPSLNESRAHRIIYGVTFYPLKVEFDFLAMAYSRLPDAPKKDTLSPLQKRRLHEKIKKKKLNCSMISKGMPAHMRIPGYRILGWLKDTVKGIEEEQCKAIKEFVENYEPVKKIKIYEEPETDEKVDLDFTLRRKLRIALKETGVHRRSIFAGRTDHPEGFDRQTLAIMTSRKGTSTKRIKKDYVDYVFKACDEFIKNKEKHSLK